MLKPKRRSSIFSSRKARLLAVIPAVLLGWFAYTVVFSQLEDGYFIYKKERENLFPYLPDWKEADYLGYFGGHLDHHIFYHDLGSVMGEVRRSDVIILGNSQTLFSLDVEAMKAFEKKFSRRPYSMAFGHAESEDFPSRILEKHGISNKVLLVDFNIFWNTRSAHADTVMASPWFEAFKFVHESTLSFYLLAVTHRFLPRYDIYPVDDKIHPIFRSRKYGAYFLDAVGMPVSPLDPDDVVHKGEPIGLDPARVARFRGFIERMAARNMKVLFFTPLTPGYHFTQKRSSLYVSELGSTVVSPEIKSILPLSTCDGRHPDAVGAKAYSRLLFADLGKALSPAGSAP